MPWPIAMAPIATANSNVAAAFSDGTLWRKNLATGAEAVADAYARFDGFPLDCFLAQPMQLASEGPPLVRAQLERLYARGVLQRP